MSAAGEKGNFRIKAMLLGVLFVVPTGVACQRAPEGAFLLDKSVQPCANAYYGIGEKVDYRKAYQCFRKLDVWQFLIVMRLNGQGAPPSVVKARELMQDWLRGNPDNANSMDGQQMEKLIHQREGKKPGEYPKIDFCRDAARTTISGDFCSAVQDRLARGQFSTAMSAIRDSLAENERHLWDQITKTFDAYERAEGDRLYQQYIDGTIRATAFYSQEWFVRVQFLKLTKLAFMTRSLQPQSRRQLDAANTKVMNAFSHNIAVYANTYRKFSEQDSSAADRKQYRQYVSEYKTAAQEAQRVWEHLRVLCEDLAAAVYGNEKKDVNWRASMGVAISRDRVAAIENNPIGPNGE